MNGDTYTHTHYALFFTCSFPVALLKFIIILCKQIHNTSHHLSHISHVSLRNGRLNEIERCCYTILKYTIELLIINACKMTHFANIFLFDVTANNCSLCRN